MALTWLPNAITLFRCVLAVVCAVSVLLGARSERLFQDAFVNGHASLGGESLAAFISRTASDTGVTYWPQLALIAFLVAAISDYVDGALARRLGAQSAFGAWLDPIADKLLVGLVLIALSVAAGSVWLMLPTAIIVLRDIYVTWLRHQLGGGLALPVMRLAKWKTATEMFAVAFLLTAGASAAAGISQVAPSSALTVGLAELGGLPLWRLGILLAWISAILSVITGETYRKAARQALQAERTRVFE